MLRARHGRAGAVHTQERCNGPSTAPRAALMRRWRAPRSQNPLHHRSLVDASKPPRTKRERSDARVQVRRRPTHHDPARGGSILSRGQNSSLGRWTCGQRAPTRGIRRRCGPMAPMAFGGRSHRRIAPRDQRTTPQRHGPGQGGGAAMTRTYGTQKGGSRHRRSGAGSRIDQLAPNASAKSISEGAGDRKNSLVFWSRHQVREHSGPAPQSCQQKRPAQQNKRAPDRLTRRPRFGFPDLRQTQEPARAML